MSRKFHAKAKRIAAPGKGSAPGTTSAPQQTGNIGKLKIIGFLVLATGLAGGVYIAAAKAAFAPVFHAYWILSAVLLCAALCLNQRNEYRYTKEASEGDPEAAKTAYYNRKKQVKYVLLALLPFLFTVLADTVYLLFFV